jgi:hypothetical protein
MFRKAKLTHLSPSEQEQLSMTLKKYPILFGGGLCLLRIKPVHISPYARMPSQFTLGPFHSHSHYDCMGIVTVAKRIPCR